jgi:hypothetical protein
MPKMVVYEGPADEFDAKNVLGHSAKFYPEGGHPGVRPRGVRGGEAVEVPDDKIEELLTYPGHRFRVVEVAAAATTETVDASRGKKGGS